jgi:hypothetical protein
VPGLAYHPKPLDCPLTLDDDMYGEQEAAKSFVKYTGWRCPYCTKVGARRHVRIAVMALQLLRFTHMPHALNPSLHAACAPLLLLLRCAATTSTL